MAAAGLTGGLLLHAASVGAFGRVGFVGFVDLVGATGGASIETTSLAAVETQTSTSGQVSATGAGSAASAGPGTSAGAGTGGGDDVAGGDLSIASDAATQSERFALFEQPERDDVRAWVARERAVSARTFAAMPARAWFHARFTALATRAVYASPERQGRYLVSGSIDADGRAAIALDTAPHAANPRFRVTDNADGAIRALQAAPDARLVAYARAASDTAAATQIWRIHDLRSGEDRSDRIVDARAGGTVVWSADSGSLFYVRVRVGQPDAIARHDLRRDARRGVPSGSRSRADDESPQRGASVDTSIDASASTSASRQAIGAADDVVIFTHPSTPRLALARADADVKADTDTDFVVLGSTDGRRFGWAWEARSAQPQSAAALRLIASVPGSHLTFVPRGRAEAGRTGAAGAGDRAGIDAHARDDVDRRGWLFLTDHEAPRGRLVLIDPDEPDGFAPARWQTLIEPARTGETLEQVVAIGRRYAARWLLSDRRVVRLHATDGRIDRDLPLPGPGTVGALSASSANELFFQFSSYVTPPGLYRYDIARRELRRLRAPDVPFDSGAYETSALTLPLPAERAASVSPAPVLRSRADDGEGDDREDSAALQHGRRGGRDAAGAAMPRANHEVSANAALSMTARRGHARDVDAPLLLYVNGFRGVPATPAFAFTVAGWLDAGGRFAVLTLPPTGARPHEADVAEIRGVLAALAREGLARPARLVVHGGGAHGGLLVAAALLREPALAAASWTASGPMDLLALDRQSPAAAWAVEYGDLASADGRARRASLSPLEGVSRPMPGATSSAASATSAASSTLAAASAASSTPAASKAFAASTASAAPSAADEMPTAHAASRSPGDGAWPSHLLTIEDPAVPAWHSYKFVAAMNESRGGGRVALLREEPPARDAAAAHARMLDERADVYAFFAARIAMTPPAPRAATASYSRAVR